MAAGTKPAPDPGDAAPERGRNRDPGGSSQAAAPGAPYAAVHHAEFLAHALGHELRAEAEHLRGQCQGVVPWQAYRYLAYRSKVLVCPGWALESSGSYGCFSPVNPGTSAC